MNFFIRYIVNCGLCFCEDNYWLLIDCIHSGKEVGFSNTPEEIINTIIEQKNNCPSTLGFAFTHLHCDHFNGTFLKQILEYYPKSSIYAPSAEISTFNLSINNSKFKFGSYTLYPITTIHDGIYKDEPHKSFVINYYDKWYFIAGDCILDDILAKQIEDISLNRISYVFISIYQLISKNGQKFLAKLNPKEIYIYHLPFAEDDIYNIREIANYSVQKNYPNFVRPKILKHNQTI